MSLTPQQRTALADAARASVEAEKRTGCPAALSIAQWAVESAWGTASPGNNCFGIKARPRHEAIQQLTTTEVIPREDVQRGDRIVKELGGGKCRIEGERNFAVFASLADCFADHAKIITTGVPYAEAWKEYQHTGSVTHLALRIAHAYATAPGYGPSLLSIMRMPEVQAALLEARGIPA